MRRRRRRRSWGESKGDCVASCLPHFDPARAGRALY
jgi:hypothetical protein